MTVHSGAECQLRSRLPPVWPLSLPLRQFVVRTIIPVWTFYLYGNIAPPFTEYPTTLVQPQTREPTFTASAMTAEDYISKFSREFSTGRYDALVTNYDYPLPIYINRTAAVANNPRDAWSFFQSLHGLIRAHGYDALSGRVVSVELPQRQRFRLWVEWSGVEGARSDVLFKSICYNVGTHGAHRTEMFTLESKALQNIEQLLKAA